MSDFPSNKTDTSRQAAATVSRSKAETLRGQIYNVIVASGKRGFTDEELQKQFRVAGNTQRPRRWELSHGRKVIRDSGLRRKTDAGKNAVVWIDGAPAVAPKEEINQAFDRISVVWVFVNPGGDNDEDPNYRGASALYINGRMVTGGDEYHNDIIRIEGWLACFTFMGWSGNYQLARLTGVESYALICNLPDSFEKLSLHQMTTSKETWENI